MTIYGHVVSSHPGGFIVNARNLRKTTIVKATSTQLCFSYARQCEQIDILLPYDRAHIPRHLDIITLLAYGTKLIITDLETIVSLKRMAATPPKPLNIFSCLILPVTRVDLVFRLPLHFYHSLDRTENTNFEAQDNVMTWMQLDSCLRVLTQLKRLQIWLEHGETCSWSVVNERAVLAPLIRLCKIQDLESSISLPKLHPTYEQEARHFTSESLVPFHLHRRLRQRHHGRTSSTGRLEVFYKADFPFLLDIIDFHDRPLAVLEEEERGYWKEGRDVEKDVNEVNTMGCRW
jgi:hypothetical protein